jgi:hypothetical protein
MTGPVIEQALPWWGGLDIDNVCTPKAKLVIPYNNMPKKCLH